MRVDRTLYDLVINYPTPCMYFDNDGVCQKMNQHSAEFFNHWKLECSNVQDICDIFGTTLETSGKILQRFGYIDYSFVSVESGYLLMFHHQSISKNESLPFGIFVMDANGVVVDHNIHCKEILGYLPGTIKSFTFLKGRRPNDGVKLSSGDWSMAKALKGKSIEGDLVDIVRKDGKRIEINISSYPLRDLHGTVIGSISYLQDVSQYREAEMQAIESKYNAEACLKNLIEIIHRISSNDDLSKMKMVADNTYSAYQIENDIIPSEAIDVSYLLDAAGYECERDSNNDVTVLCNIDNNRLVTGNSHLKDAFKIVINNIAKRTDNESEITINIKDYCEHGREYHRIEIKDELAENLGEKIGLIDCNDQSDCNLTFASKIVQSLDGRIWAEAYANDAENYYKFVIILPSLSCTAPINMNQDAESYAY